MPSGLVRPNSEIEPIVGIQFGIFSHEEIEKRSVVEITNSGTYDGAEPRIGGLFDPRMGVLDNGKTCRSCGQSNHNCPGHFGHLKLARPVYYYQFFHIVLNILRCVCIRCSKLLIDKDRYKDVAKRRGEARWRAILTACSNMTRCGQDIEDGCGARQPDRYKREGIARIVAEWDKIEGPDVNNGTAVGQDLEVEYVLRLFRRITDEDVDFMGFNRFWCRPDWMICTTLAVPPPQVRPSVIQDNNQRSEDDLTYKLFEIVNTNSTLQDKINANADKKIIDEYTNVLQYHIATLVDNQIPGVAPSAQRSGRPLKSIQQRLGSKEGRIRYNIQGKRVEFSARSVITPDPNLSVAEIGVPLKIAMNLTVPERVTQFNRAEMYKLIQNGPDKHPGAKTLVRQDGRMISLRHVKANEIVLYQGDIINRHLNDGDIILFNRQPTLHRMSMMGHRVKVLPYNTFRLNVCVVSPYNADFDGDEMNAHIPQSLEASTELSEIAAVPHQIVAPRHAKPVIGIVQDTLAGSWRITRPKIGFNRREFMNMLMWNRRFDGEVPLPAKGKQWSGQQLISTLLPPINLETGNSFYNDAKTAEEKKDNFVIIREGQIIQGILDKDIFSKPPRSIVHTIVKDYGSTEAVNFIDSMQNTIEQFLVYNGFSVGISDLVADEDTRKAMEKGIKQHKAEIENILLQVHLGLFDNNTGKSNQQEFEDKIYTELNKATEAAGKIGLGSLAEENRLIAMVRAGSKGSVINIAQMLACVGQVSIDGKRIAYGFSDRTLPHYKKYDDGAEARGFVESSFIKGLTPQEFFFHAMSGREGLIDTAVKTADTGYIQRQLIKAMEDLVTHFDGTVRDSLNNIVQFHYGEDGLNSTKVESQSLPLQKLTEQDILTSYSMRGVSELPRTAEEQVALDAFARQVLADRTMLVDGILRISSKGSTFASTNLERVILNVQNKFNLKRQATETPSDLVPSYVLEGINKVIERTQAYHPLWAAMLRFYFAPHKLIGEEKFTKIAFDALCEMIIIKNWQSWAQPGEQVGIIAAQSIGEPSTQMTLNTFHLAGVASKSNVTRGVPRLKELLKVTKSPKAISLTIGLKPEFREDKDKAREVMQDLELTLLRDVATRAAIYYDPKDEETILPEDKDLIKFYKVFEKSLMESRAEEEKDEEDKTWSRWMLRLELDRERLFMKNISMDDIALVLRSEFASEVNLIYSDFNSPRLIMRMRLPAMASSGLDDLANLKKFVVRLLNGIVIRGVPGIKAASFRQDKNQLELKEGSYKALTQYILDTDGTNFQAVMTHPMVDGRRLVSSHVHDIYENLGIEATRQVLLNEISTLFEEAGVNYRHLGLLCDVMTTAGRLMSVDRYGINRKDIGPIAKASFEETEKILLRASVFGEIDPVTGVSANIMTGQTIRGGTAFTQLLLDEDALLRLQQGLSPMEDDEEQDVEEASEEMIASELHEDTKDPCSSAHLRMNVIMPQQAVLLEEPDIEIYEA